jgi:hypothetical protein
MMKKLFFLGVLMGLLLSLFGCSSSEEQIHIRIRNESTRNITRFWLGSGSGSGGSGTHSYGAIKSGETTSYQGLKAEYGSYGNFNFVTEDRERFLASTFPNEDIGRVQLEPGYYTFAITIVGDQASVRIIREATPSR